MVSSLRCFCCHPPRRHSVVEKQYPPPLLNSPKADWSEGLSCLPGSPPGCMDCYLGLVPRVRERAEFTRSMNAQKLTADLRIWSPVLRLDLMFASQTRVRFWRKFSAVRTASSHHCLHVPLVPCKKHCTFVQNNGNYSFNICNHAEFLSISSRKGRLGISKIFGVQAT